jgi:TonB family protein
VLHALLLGAALVLFGPRAHRRTGEGARAAREQVATFSRPAPAAAPEEVEGPAPEELDLLPMPEEASPALEVPEALPDVEVLPADLPAPESAAPATPPVEVPYEPGLADAKRRVRPPAAPSAPAPAPAPAAPPAARPPPTRAALVALETPNPPVPAEVVLAGVLTLQLQYTIGADGRIVDAVVTSSSGDPVLDASTRDFVLRRWRYQPPGSERRVSRAFVFRRQG